MELRSNSEYAIGRNPELLEQQQKTHSHISGEWVL
jgi:hypothetical protein